MTQCPPRAPSPVRRAGALLGAREGLPRQQVREQSQNGPGDRRNMKRLAWVGGRQAEADCESLVNHAIKETDLVIADFARDDPAEGAAKARRSASCTVLKTWETMPVTHGQPHISCPVLHTPWTRCGWSLGGIPPPRIKLATPTRSHLGASPNVLSFYPRSAMNIG